MENKEKESVESPSMMTYAIGAVLVLVVVAGAWYFRSQNAQPITEPTAETQEETPGLSPTPGPITELACDSQYFNPKIGFNEYYLSVEGGDINEATKVDCAFSVSVEDEEIASATAESPLTAAPQRGGKTFRCTTDAVELTPNVKSTVTVTLTDDLDASAECFAEFTFPSQ